MSEANRGKIWFDLSTSARWSGHAVGIIRVEQEFARRARKHLGDRVDFCIYVAAGETFYRLRPEAVDQILRGELQLEFSRPDATPRPADGSAGSWKQRLRDLTLASPQLYRFVQRLRGHDFTLAQVQHMREQLDLARERARERVGSVEAAPPARPPTPALSAVSGPVPLEASSVIVSGGLDWEHKDVRAIYKAKRRIGFRYAAIIYDLIPILYPHFVVPAYVDLLNDYFGELFWTADAALCISACTQRDMLGFCEDNGVPPPASAHFPLGSDLPSGGAVEAADPHHLLEGKSYAIFVSTIETRKNHRLLYQAWDYCLRRGMIDGETCRLVFVGRPGWNIGDLMHEMQANPVTRDTIVTLSNVSDAELSALYAHAAFGLFPSHYEGYGLSLAELLSLGKVCLSSDGGALPEVGGGLVTYRDPSDVIGWAHALAELFNDPAGRAAMEARIKAEYAPVTWDHAAAAFYDRLHRLVPLA